MNKEQFKALEQLARDWLNAKPNVYGIEYFESDKAIVGVYRAIEGSKHESVTFGFSSCSGVRLGRLHQIKFAFHSVPNIGGLTIGFIDRIDDLIFVCRGFLDDVIREQAELSLEEREQKRRREIERLEERLQELKG